MPPKKKPQKAGEEEDPTLNIIRFYKKKCDLNGIPPQNQCKFFKDKVDALTNEGEQLEKLHLWDELGPVHVRAMFDALSDLNYTSCKSVKLYKSRAEDEGTRAVCNYMDKVKKVEVLDLLSNDITPLGCEFLGRVLHPGQGLGLIKLKLDHNRFGTAGLAKLAEGLAQNNTLESLSLRYCDIDSDGSKYIQQILAYIESKLIKLKLQGNLLRNKGVFQIFRALEINDTLELINLADNQFGEGSDIPVIDKICEVIVTNKSLGSYDLSFNGLYEESAKRFLECIKQGKHVYKMEISQNISKQVVDDLKNAMKKNKPKKKKKGKGGKGGGGKKKK